MYLKAPLCPSLMFCLFVTPENEYKELKRIIERIWLLQRDTCNMFFKKVRQKITKLPKNTEFFKLLCKFRPICERLGGLE